MADEQHQDLKGQIEALEKIVMIQSMAIDRLMSPNDKEKSPFYDVISYLHDINSTTNPLAAKHIAELLAKLRQARSSKKVGEDE